MPLEYSDGVHLGVGCFVVEFLSFAIANSRWWIFLVPVPEGGRFPKPD